MKGNICKNCGHNIIKRNAVWKHKVGGTYCKISRPFPESYLYCLCNNPEPIKIHAHPALTLLDSTAEGQLEEARTGTDGRGLGVGETYNVSHPSVGSERSIGLSEHSICECGHRIALHFGLFADCVIGNCNCKKFKPQSSPKEEKLPEKLSYTADEIRTAISKWTLTGYRGNPEGYINAADLKRELGLPPQDKED